MQENIGWKNNDKVKLMIIVGTRPEIIKLSEIIKKCKEYFDVLLVHTGQNYDYSLKELLFNDLDIDQPDINLNAVGKNLGATIGGIIEKSYAIMNQLKPDALLVLGDTNSCLAAISAKRLHIPIFHLEAGNRCKDERLPEETNRRIVDIISDVNLPYTEHARRYLMESGCSPERTFVIGSPMREVLSLHFEKIVKSDILNRISDETGIEIKKKKYFLLSAHREENIDDQKNLESLFSALNDVARRYDMPILYSCHPRSRYGLKKMSFKLDERIIAHEPVGFIDYNNLQMNAYCVLSDSGTLAEESSYYASIGSGFPAVSLRTSTERPEAIEKGTMVISGVDKTGIQQAIELAVRISQNRKNYSVPTDYLDEDVCEKVPVIIQSYVGIVRDYVWHNM
uniref:non-hydrolyzing UDP-N-acetylglucosamine 2-epimerase n=1 Tax=Eubacterium cellulosolvens TaxID=29322 RepID=UPI0004880E54|nr:UDP-N-acetylglucosamine 2-epimerase (non-hydrolyzing) [[Eubacterium] cellulosolvens]